jgi:hypothetical protein
VHDLGSVTVGNADGHNHFRAFGIAEKPGGSILAVARGDVVASISIPIATWAALQAAIACTVCRLL